MPAFDPVLADIRFGCGLSPYIPPPADAEALIGSLTAPDGAAERHEVEDFETFMARMIDYNEQLRIRRKTRGTPEAEAATKQIRVLNKHARIAQMTWMAQQMARRTTTATPFRERLAGFWADHFTVVGKAGLTRRGASPYVESAIRPHLAGKFETLLIAAVTHPMMVIYLDQRNSMGPNSPRALKRDAASGLNENLAREILELHTMGPDGPYTQTDVRELAELLTGLTMQVPAGRKFRRDYAEPGAETVLGKTYGGDPAKFTDIWHALEDIARHPATARHLARKLARHFVSDTPDPALVTAIETALLDSEMDLTQAYRAMVTHPAAWSTERPNVKRPFEFVSSELRALAMPPKLLLGLDERRFKQRIQRPMVLMGHAWERPDGPDGLEEADDAWITPQGLAARLQWAVSMPQVLMPGKLPDPRIFVKQALADRATPAVHFAAKAAESRADGVGLVLASPAFQRM